MALPLLLLGIVHPYVNALMYKQPVLLPFPFFSPQLTWAANWKSQHEQGGAGGPVVVLDPPGLYVAAVHQEDALPQSHGGVEVA
jgi:hypothetical protein